MFAASCVEASRDSGAGAATPPGKADDATSAELYPVDPHVHVRDPSLDPLDPGSISPTILNPVAYAREVARLVTGDGVSGEVPAIAAALTAAATSSGVELASGAVFHAVTASAEAQRAYADQVRAGARGLPPDAPLPRLGAEIVDARARLAACVADGHAEADCCRAAAWFDVLAGDDPITTASYVEATDVRLVADAQPFSHLGAKTWLSVCGPVLADAPVDLDGLRARYGDYLGAGWQSELHPASMAKQAGRRIYRDREAGSPMVVAESLAADCAVRETEVVLRRADGQLSFWSFAADGARVSHGYFPARKGVDAIKFTPDACMGCHYTFDTREFVVVTPSFAALQLVRVTRGGDPEWEDVSGCARKGERQIQHDAPVVDR